MSFDSVTFVVNHSIVIVMIMIIIIFDSQPFSREPAIVRTDHDDIRIKRFCSENILFKNYKKIKTHLL